jgi:prepilin-type N-terminal cleavage/methylation domain-containing protein
MTMNRFPRARVRPRTVGGPATSMARTRRGFSLVELMIAMVVFGCIMTGAFTFLLAQSKGFRALALKSAKIQNGRFGRDIMRTEIRTAGTNVTDEQPVLVYASDSVFAFNSDITTNRLDSAEFTGAVYVDTYASNAEVESMNLANAAAIPGSSPAFVYPLRNYTRITGTDGEAEMVTFRFTRDTTSTDPLDIMLVRQVNNFPREIIATGLRKSPAAPLFRYWYDPTKYDAALTALDTVPRAWMPLAKTAPQRGITPDTGTAPSARIDAVRAVEVTYEATLPTKGTRNTIRYIVPMPNTAVGRQARACGRVPIAPSAPSPQWRGDSLAVMVSWPKATDDGAGETDAVRYVLWRRLNGASEWGDPLATISVVSGTSTYYYKDGGVTRGGHTKYQYALAVQDCTPNLSSLAGSGMVNVP